MLCSPVIICTCSISGLVDYPTSQRSSFPEAKPLALTSGQLDSGSELTSSSSFVVLTTGYLLTGLALFSMCLQLLELRRHPWMSWTARRLGLTAPPPKKKWSTSPSQSTYSWQQVLFTHATPYLQGLLWHRLHPSLEKSIPLICKEILRKIPM